MGLLRRNPKRRIHINIDHELQDFKLLPPWSLLGFEWPWEGLERRGGWRFEDLGKAQGLVIQVRCKRLSSRPLLMMDFILSAFSLRFRRKPKLTRKLAFILLYYNSKVSVTSSVLGKPTRWGSKGALIYSRASENREQCFSSFRVSGFQEANSNTKGGPEGTGG